MDDKELRASFPANPKINKVQQEEKNIPEKKVEKVVTGKVKRQKQGLFKRFTKVFLEDDTKSVGDYIVHDVLIPAAKSLICDMIGWGGFAEMLLFGDRRRRRGQGSSLGRGTVSYGSFYKTLDRNSLDRPRELSRSGRIRHDFDEIILESRGEAEEVIAHLNDMIVDYGQATVSDLYDLVGITPSFTDEKYGWTDLRGSGVVRVRGGYLLDLPRPQLLD